MKRNNSDGRSTKKVQFRDHLETAEKDHSERPPDRPDPRDPEIMRLIGEGYDNRSANALLKFRGKTEEEYFDQLMEPSEALQIGDTDPLNLPRGTLPVYRDFGLEHSVTTLEWANLLNQPVFDLKFKPHARLSLETIDNSFKAIPAGKRDVKTMDGLFKRQGFKPTPFHGIREDCTISAYRTQQTLVLLFFSLEAPPKLVFHLFRLIELKPTI